MYVNAAVPAALVVAVPLAVLGPAIWKLTEAPESGAPLLSFSVATIVCAVPITLGPRTGGLSVSMLPVTGAVTSVTVAEADLVGSTTLLAVTVTVC